MSAADFISYLTRHNISDYKQRGNEVSFTCPFNGCDDDHRGNEELHCSFNLEKCAYHCFKCGEKGNFLTLTKHFGDYEDYFASQKTKTIKGKDSSSLEQKVQKIHRDTREEVRDYFNSRGINNDSIDRFMLGLGEFGGRHGFVIPIFNRNGKIAYVKIRKTPEDESAEVLADAISERIHIPKYYIYPTGTETVLVGEDQLVKSTSSDVLICEGELDRIIAIQEGVEIPVVTGGGAQTFKDEWIEQLQTMRNIFVCMDRDEPGKRATEKLTKLLAKRIPSASIYEVTLPFDDDSKGDLTDYFVKLHGKASDLFSKYANFCCGAKPIDVTQFKELTVADIANVLDSTIKFDFVSKVITFLAMLLTYTESDQQNIMFNADSSTGKTYICQEVSKYFPPQDVKIYGKTSPSAFYYSEDLQERDKKTGAPVINLERRVLIFAEQPDTQLQENLRSLLSHDNKRIPFAITNRGKNGKKYCYGRLYSWLPVYLLLLCEYEN